MNTNRFEVVMNLLDDRMLRVRTGHGETLCTLPGLLAGAFRNEIEALPGVRPHQRHPVHAFLVQLAAIVLDRKAIDASREAPWREELLELANGDGDAWRLVAPLDRRAFLQAPVEANASDLSKSIPTPDALDILVSAKNHDLKGGQIWHAVPELWAYALITLQTTEGFLGQGNYGVSRMNGGFSNRCGIGVAPPGGPGAHIRRDAERLKALRDDVVRTHGYDGASGIALTWLVPWDGTTSIPAETLDPYYIEICRRVRLQIDRNGRIHARAGSSKGPRIAPRSGGVTGDPWTPTVIEKEGSKALTVDASGFGYTRAVRLLFGNGEIVPAPLQVFAATDEEAGLSIVARALVRGQGKTEGYHERRIPVSNVVTRRRREVPLDRVAALANERVKEAGALELQVLKPALLMLLQNGPDEINRKNATSLERADRFVRQVDGYVDRSFFPALWHEIEAADTGEDERWRARVAWQRDLIALARRVLLDADASSPKAGRRRYRALARAESLFSAQARKVFPDAMQKDQQQ